MRFQEAANQRLVLFSRGHRTSPSSHLVFLQSPDTVTMMPPDGVRRSDAGYSPNVGEDGFSEVRIQEPAYGQPEKLLVLVLADQRQGGAHNIWWRCIEIHSHEYAALAVRHVRQMCPARGQISGR